MTKTVLEVSRIVTAGGSSSIIVEFYADSFDGKILLQFSSDLSGWKYDITTAKYEWEELSLNHNSFANSILNWVNSISEINTVNEFVNFFQGSFVGEDGFSPIGDLKFVSIEE